MNNASFLTSDKMLTMGVITGAHGIKGHVKIKAFNEDPSLLKSFGPFLDDVTGESINIDKILSQKDDVLVASLQGVSDRNKAEDLKGHSLLMERSKLPDLEADDFYYDDLIGCQVEDGKGQVLGHVTAVYNFGAGDMLEVREDSGKSEFVPFNRQIFPSVLVSEGRVIMNPEALLYLEAEEEGDHDR